MAQSLVKNYLHLVYSTKQREHFLDEGIQPEMWAYMGALLKDRECYPVKVGGHTDHAHLLFLLSQKIALMDLVEDVKKISSKWIKGKGERYENFYWQRGYGAFSVSISKLKKVIDYIERQREHHRTMDFQNEFRGLLKKHKVDYDERYVWD